MGRALDFKELVTLERPQAGATAWGQGCVCY
jgi:hypothetical protein